MGLFMRQSEANSGLYLPREFRCEVILSVYGIALAKFSLAILPRLTHYRLDLYDSRDAGAIPGPTV